MDELVPNALQLLKAPGVVYTVALEYFAADPRLGPGKLVSHQPVPVISEIEVPSINDELVKIGVDLVAYDNVLAGMNKRGRNLEEPEIEHLEDRFQ